MVNDQGGIAGRKINFIYYDDAFNPAKTVEQTRRLIESDNVAFLFSMRQWYGGQEFGGGQLTITTQTRCRICFCRLTATNGAITRNYPWTMGFAPSSRTEAQIFAKYALSQKPDAKFALLYQNDDLGKDFVSHMVAARRIGRALQNSLVTAALYEVTEPTLDSQIVALRATNADVLISGVTAKFAAQAIRKVYELDWRPIHCVTSGASSVSSTIMPVGPERAQGLITSVYIKDPSDPAWADDPGMKEYLAFMAKYFGDGNPREALNTYGYTVTSVLRRLLEQCNGNFARETIMREANNLRNVEVATLLPGVRVNTSPTNHHPLQQMQLQRWEGQGYVRFGNIIEGANL